MTSLNMRCKSAVFAAMMVATSFFGTNQVQAFSVKKAMAVTGTVAVLATWVRLNSKGSKWDYTTENWRADFEAFLNSYNICDAQARATLLALFDKWIVGRQFSIIDVSYRSEDETGMITTRKDKMIKARPFGLMGLFDAYVLYQIKKINEHVKELQGLNALVKDPIATLTKDPK